MFGCEGVLYASNKRQCRMNKQIDYVKTNVGKSKKKKTSNIEQLDTNDDQTDFIHSVGKQKNTKNNIPVPTIKLNTKKKFVEKSMANKTLPPVVKTTVLNQMSNEQPNKLKITENKKHKKSIVNKNPLELSINENLSESVIHAKPPVSAYDKTLSESNMLNFLPEQATQCMYTFKGYWYLLKSDFLFFIY